MTLLDSGFHIEDSPFRLLDPAQWIPNSQNGWIPIVFSDIILSFVFRQFSRSNSAILKNIVRKHNKFCLLFRFTSLNRG